MPPEDLPSDPVEAAIADAFADATPSASPSEEALAPDDSSPSTEDQPFVPGPEAAPGQTAPFPWPDDLRQEYGDLIDRHQGDPAKVFKTLREQGNYIASGAHRQQQPQAPTLLPTLDMSDEELYALAEKRPTDAAMYVLDRIDNLPQDVAQNVLNYWVSVEPYKAMQYQMGQLENRMQGWVQQQQAPQVEYLKHEWAGRVDNMLRDRNADWSQYETRIAEAISSGQFQVPDRAFTSPEAMAEALEDVLGAIKYRDWLVRSRNAAAATGTPAPAPPTHQAVTQTKSTAPPPTDRARDPKTGQFVATDQDIIADIVGKADVVI